MESLVFGICLIGLGLTLLLCGHQVVHYEVARRRRNRYPKWLVDTAVVFGPAFVYSFAALSLVCGAAVCINVNS